MRTFSRRTSRIVTTFLLGIVTASLLAVGVAAPASASSARMWTNGLYSHAYYLQSDGDSQPLSMAAGGSVESVWHEVLNSDGTYDEVDWSGYCLTAYGRNVLTMPCNSAVNATDGHMRWREINMGSGNGWKLQNVLNGYYLDWTGASTAANTVYAHAGDANNPNERWY
jgi:hypothetical protein